MYSEFISDMSFNLLECKIMNIHTIDEKIVIGLGGIDKGDIEFKSLGIVIKNETHSTWYPYSSIKKIEVY